MCWAKEINQSFWGLLHTGSALILILGDPKHHCCPPIRPGDYKGWVMNGALAQVCLTVSLLGPPVVISLVSECIIGIDILSS